MPTPTILHRDLTGDDLHEPKAHTHPVSEIDDVTATASEINALDGITASTTELNYTDGVTSAIQTQLDGKSSTSHQHTLANGATDVTASSAEVNILDGATLSTTELNYVDGVTSAIQTQLDGKSATSHSHTVDGLSDAAITSVADNEVLAYDSGSSTWINQTASEAGLATSSHTHLLAAGATDVTSSAAELNILDGATLSTTELNYVDGVTSAIQTQLDAKAADSAVVHDTGDETIAGVKTFSSDPLIPDEAYGAGWDGSLEPPTKNAVYDKIETLAATGDDIVYSVGAVDADYIVDGTNDHTEINSAISALSSTGGVVFLKEGTYNLGGAITMSSDNVILQGAGWNTVLYKASNFNANMINVTGDNTVVRDLQVDGNRANMSSDNHGIVVDTANRVKVISCFVKSTYHHGINTPDSTDVLIDGCYVTDTGHGSGADGVGIIAGATASNIKISNCTVYDAGYHGLQVYTDTNKVFISNCHVSTVGQRTTTGCGIKLNPNVQDVYIANCYFGTGNAQGLITDDDSGTNPISNISIVSSTFENFDASGLRLDGPQNVSVIGCTIRNNGQASGGDATQIGIKINDGTTYTAEHYRIIGCEIYDTQGTATQTRPIGIYGASTNIYITGAEAHGHLTSDAIYHDSGATGSVYYGNNFGGLGKHDVAVGTEPRMIMTETNTGANNKRWDIRADAGTLTFRTLSDNDNTRNAYMTVTRSNASPSGVAFAVDVTVPDEAYGSGWDGSTEVPTKNALYDKIETISAGSGITESLALAYAAAL